MRINTVVPRIYLYLTGLTIGIVALCGLLQFGLPSTVLHLPLTLQHYAPLTFGLFLVLASSLLLYLKAPLTSRGLAVLLLLCTSTLLLADFSTGFHARLSSVWPSMATFPAELNTEVMSLLVIAALLLIQHPSVFAESLKSFIGGQLLSLGLLITSLVLSAYSLVTPLQLISLPLSVAFCLVGHSMGLLTYRIYTRALIPPEPDHYTADVLHLDHYKALLAESTIGVWELNMSTNALRMDQQALDLYGLDPNKAPFVLQDWLAIVAPEDQNILQSALTQSTQQDQPIDLVFCVTPTPNTRRHIRTRAQRLLSPGELKGILLGISFDVTNETKAALSLNQLNAMLLQYAYYDSLTGLMNRRAFDDAAERELAEARRRQFSLAGFFIDLDWFKSINDIHGHRTGDRVLVAVAKRIQRTLRAEDTVCRLGGDEFFALLGHIHSPAQAKHIAEQLIKDIQRPIRLDGMELRVGASIGIAFYPSDAPTTALLMARADEAMQHAKHLGKGRCACYNE